MYQWYCDNRYMYYLGVGVIYNMIGEGTLLVGEHASLFSLEG